MKSHHCKPNTNLVENSNKLVFPAYQLLFVDLISEFRAGMNGLQTSTPKPCSSPGQPWAISVASLKLGASTRKKPTIGLAFSVWTWKVSSPNGPFSVGSPTRWRRGNGSCPPLRVNHATQSICSEPFRSLVAKFLTGPLAGSPGTPKGKGTLLAGRAPYLSPDSFKQMSSNVLIFVRDSDRLASRN